MFVELSTFLNEYELYNRRVADIKNEVTDQGELARRLEEERLKFKGITRKYLPTAMSFIKEKFNCDYSLYKVGKDVDANFRTIETNISKTQSEINIEMQQFVQLAIQNNFSDEDKNKLNLAINVIMSYVDDTRVDEDKNKEFYLNHSKVVASSLELPISPKVKTEVQPVQVQYNPYANAPVNLNNAVSTNGVETNSKPMLDDPFAALYSGINNSSTTVSTSETKSSAFPTVVFPTQDESVTNTQTVGANNVMSNYRVPSISDVVTPIIPVVNTNNPMPGYQAPSVSNTVPNTVVNNTNNSMPNYQTSSGNNIVVPNIPSFNTNIAMPNYQTPNNEMINPSIGVAPMMAPNNAVGRPQTTTDSKPEGVAIVTKLVCAILIPLLSILAAVIYVKLNEIDAFSKTILKMPDMISKFATWAIIAIICFVLGKPVVALAKRNSKNVERFLVAPAVLSYAVYALLLYLIEISVFEMSSSLNIKLVLYIGAGAIFYLYYVTFLFIQAFVANNSGNDFAVKWNIFEKLGFIFIFYVFMIPTIASIVPVEFLTEFVQLIQLTDTSVGEYMGTIMLCLSIGIPILITISRLIQKKKVGA